MAVFVKFLSANYSSKKAHDVAEDVHKNIEQRFPKVKHIMIHVNPYEGEEGKC
nr:cation transporter dimerization domain-containing protein [uncultured Eubacterium sp.]